MEAIATPQPPVTVRVFVQRFSSTPRGARLARHLALNVLHDWDIPYGSHASETAELIVSELATNAVTHGRVPGRDFELRLRHSPGVDGARGALCIEVSDTRGEQLPPGPAHLVLPPPDADGGRGLVLVDALADRWAVLDRGPGKTVRAELDVSCCNSTQPQSSSSRRSSVSMARAGR
ncbi:ATP-binding protein [Streptomyces sp. NPDC059118]|uniref:ATP-binding protein n=1 Tax=unclassified Streptomyces TaxID=2593676 RepID=UPI0036BC7A8F